MVVKDGAVSRSGQRAIGAQIPRRVGLRVAVLIGGLIGGMIGGPAARADNPLSAIDWLSKSVVTPVAAATRPVQPPTPSSAPLATNALPEAVTVSPLGQTSLDATGLLPPAKTGLPLTLWGLGRTADIAAAIHRQRLEDLPALQGLLMTLLLAEAEPPVDAGSSGTLFLVRIDKLLEIGALDQAMALIQASGAQTSPDLFRRTFDIALLTGAEDRACRALDKTPSLSPALPARIFCLARGGDWETAAVTLQTAQALGQIAPETAELLTRFLDPALAEDSAPLPAPALITPLDLRIFEAIGEPLPTTNLPVAFAHSDLAEINGWKSRIEAAERLSRAGAIAPNLLLGMYTLQKPAASGGVWDRVAAFQAFEVALGAADPDALAKTLPAALTRMGDARLEVVFAELFAERLAPIPLTGPAADLSLTTQLLSTRSERLTAGKTSTDPRLTFALALARGKPEGVPTNDSLSRAIAAGFGGVEIPDELLAMKDQKRVGELILTAAEKIARGLEGDISDVALGLTLLRQLGLEDVARRTALELVLLERRG